LINDNRAYLGHSSFWSNFGHSLFQNHLLIIILQHKLKNKLTVGHLLSGSSGGGGGDGSSSSSGGGGDGSSSGGRGMECVGIVIPAIPGVVAVLLLGFVTVALLGSLHLLQAGLLVIVLPVATLALLAGVAFGFA